MDPFIVEAIGWGGTAIFLSGLSLVSFGKIAGNGIAFNLMMLAQSIFFIIYAALKDASPYVLVELSMAIIALVAIDRIISKRKLAKNEPKT